MCLVVKNVLHSQQHIFFFKVNVIYAINSSKSYIHQVVLGNIHEGKYLLEMPNYVALYFVGYPVKSARIDNLCEFRIGIRTFLLFLMLFDGEENFPPKLW